MLQPSASELTALLQQLEFTRRFGFEVVKVGDGECELAVPYLPEYDRPGGIVSGLVYMHAADVTFWLAIKTRLGRDEGSVTSSMTTAFLGSARQEALTCHARVIKLGRRLIYGEAECSAAGQLLTHHTLTYVRSAQTA